jgi:two-component sensor histidine kinase
MPTAEHTPERAPSLNAFMPHIKRGLMMCLVWSLGLALFLRGLELIVLPDTRWHLGLLANIIATVVISVCAQGANLLGVRVLGPWVWRRSQAARDRYARDGLYAILPGPAALLLVVCATLVGTFTGYHLWLLVARWASIGLPLGYDDRGLSMSLLLASFSTVVLGFIDFLLIRSGLERARVEAAQRQLVQAQLQRLQAQMEPHMLFNTLANLHALIDSRPEKAQDMLMHLITYLRATLTANRTDTLTLSDEMARIHDYLVLMQIRMGERLRIEIDVPEGLGHVRIPPMLIQPLVENAIKHGLDPMLDGGSLRVSAREHEGMIEIRVQDDGQGLHAPAADAQQTGFGLSCIKERLQTCYGHAGQLSLTSLGQAGGAVATLRIPLTMPT